MLSALILTVFRALSFSPKPAQAVVPVRAKRRSQNTNSKYPRY